MLAVGRGWVQMNICKRVEKSEVDELNMHDLCFAYQKRNHASVSALETASAIKKLALLAEANFDRAQSMFALNICIP
jgi:hypothetical protein